jgi:hypothetical protein
MVCLGNNNDVINSLKWKLRYIAQDIYYSEKGKGNSYWIIKRVGQYSDSSGCHVIHSNA